MRINWGRGFLRLWIVASLGWAAFVGVLAGPDPAWFDLSRVSADPAYAKPVPGRAQNVGLRLATANNEAFVAAVQQADRAALNKTLLWFAWMVGLPSALALLVGLSVRWVVRGFVDPAIRRAPRRLAGPSLWRESAAEAAGLDAPQSDSVAPLTHRVARSPHYRA